jgi:excisionase family DNA binding protein
MSFLTIKQAARKLQCSQGTVRGLIERGALPAVDLSPDSARRNWRIPVDGLKSLGVLGAVNQAGRTEAGTTAPTPAMRPLPKLTRRLLS